MLPEHRAKINENMSELVRVQNLNAVIKEFERREISFPDMIERLKAEAQAENRNLAELLFRHVQRRGPLAFKVLVQTLHSTGNAQLAYVLDSDSCYLSREDLNLSKLSISTGIQTPLSHASSASSLSLSLLSPRLGNGHPSESLNVDSDHVSDSDTDESKQPLKVVVEKATLYNGGKTAGCYQMMSRPRGFALIINNINFEGEPSKLRLGAQVDSMNLEILLNDFGFEVTSLRNVYKKEMLDPDVGHLKQFIDKFQEREVDCCFVAIMSHGDDHFCIDTSDPPSLNRNSNRVHLWDDIISPFFNNDTFKVFYGKPKVFLIQACRGHNNNVGVPIEGKILRAQPFFDTSSLQVVTPTIPQVPQLNHIFILQSTIPGYKAMRDRYRGSWFIECVCEVLMNHAWNHSLDELYRKVAGQLERLITMEGNMQTCDFQHVGYGKTIYFNPGLFVDAEDIADTIPEGACDEIQNIEAEGVED